MYTSLQVDTYIYMKTHLDLLLQEVDFVLLLQKLLLLSCNLWTEDVKLSDMSNSFSHVWMVTVNSVFEALGFAFVFHTYLPRRGARSWSVVCVRMNRGVLVCVNTDLFSFVKLSYPEATLHTTKLKHTLLYANTFRLLHLCWRGPES